MGFLPFFFFFFFFVTKIFPQIAPEADVSPPAITLEKQLKQLLDAPLDSPEVVKFVAYLDSVYARENFNFLKDVKVFENEMANEKVSAHQKEKKAKKIYETYFAADSKNLLNMSSRASAPVKNRFAPLNPKMFKLAVNTIKQNLQDDCLVRFLQIEGNKPAVEEKEEEEKKKEGREELTASGKIINPLFGRKISASASPPVGRKMSASAPTGGDVLMGAKKLELTGETLEDVHVGPKYEDLDVVNNPLLRLKMKKRSSSEPLPSQFQEEETSSSNNNNNTEATESNNNEGEENL
jgi:hypothetical protein